MNEKTERLKEQIEVVGEDIESLIRARHYHAKRWRTALRRINAYYWEYPQMTKPFIEAMRLFNKALVGARKDLEALEQELAKI